MFDPKDRRPSEQSKPPSEPPSLPISRPSRASQSSRPFSDRPRLPSAAPRPFSDRPRLPSAAPRPFSDRPRQFSDKPRPFSDPPRRPSDKPRLFSDRPKPVFDFPCSGVDGFAEDIERTIENIMRGRSLVYVRALTLLKEIVAGPSKVEAVIAGLEQAWGKKSFNIYYHRPLLLLAALRAEAIAVHRHPVARGLASLNPDALAVTREALLQALSPGRIGLWCALATRSMQTNDVSRSVVWMWPAALAKCNNQARPLGLVDIGAAGGLNLIADRLSLGWEQSNGARLPAVVDPDVCLRVGFDVRPLDFRGDADLAWARACIWAGDVHRLTQFDRAVAELRTSYRLKTPPTVRLMNATFAASKLNELLAKMPKDGLLIVYQTLVRDYIETEKKSRYEASMRRWLAD